MPFGAGKYDDLCTHVREEAKAEGAIVIVFNGEFGPGFSAQLNLMDMMQVPRILRDIADQIDNPTGGVQ